MTHVIMIQYIQALLFYLFLLMDGLYIMGYYLGSKLKDQLSMLGREQKNELSVVPHVNSVTKIV